MVSGSSDQTIMIWDLRRLKSASKIYPLATLFVADNGEWVLWTKEGFFNASPKGAKYIGYHLNRGAEQAAEFVAVDKLYNTFYRPDLVEKALQGADLTAYARDFNIDKILSAGLAPALSR